MYVDTEKIFNEAAKENLQIVFDNLGTLYGFLAKNYITLNYILKSNETLLRCILAEEIGHWKYSPNNFYVLDHSYVARVLDHRMETAAFKWAVTFLIPDPYEFINLYTIYAADSPQAGVYALCEYYKVTPLFINLRGKFIGRMIK